MSESSIKKVPKKTLHFKIKIYIEDYVNFYNPGKLPMG